MICDEVNRNTARLDEAICGRVEQDLSRLCAFDGIPVNSQEDALLGVGRFEGTACGGELEPGYVG